MRRALNELSTEDAISSEFQEFAEWKLIETGPLALANETYTASRINLSELVAAIEDVEVSSETTVEARVDETIPTPPR